MVIQVHWIQSDLVIRQVNFERDVREAGSEVIRHLERIELTELYRKRMSSAGTPESYASALDSINRILLFEMQNITTRQDLEDFMNKFFMSRDLIRDMYFIPRHLGIENRVDEPVLDSLINLELGKRNIRTDYEYAVLNPLQGKLLMQKTGNYSDILMDNEKTFQFELFPNDTQSGPSVLLLYFPHERQFLVSQLWNLLVISIILLLIVIISFSYTIVTIFRQRKLSEMKSDFFNNMTHEFKTPVSTISLACEALMDKDIQKSEELYTNYINVINEENRRLGYMSEMILQSAALEKGEIELKMEKADIHDILNDVIKNIGIQIEIKDGRIESHFNAGNSDIDVDRLHMTNVFQNLLDNANKYTPVKPKIVVSTRNENSSLIVRIEDNGIGISAANQRKIFDKLYRVPGGNLHNFKGFGLGLTYVKSIVEKHGGNVRLESEIDRGTKFEVILPLS
jgi:two-component system phosphate regulon sensor histidine kinase PhoR